MQPVALNEGAEMVIAVNRQGREITGLILPPANADAAERILAGINWRANITWSENPGQKPLNFGDVLINIFILIGVLMLVCLGGGVLVKKIREAGMRFPILACERVVNPEFLKAAGAAAEGVIATYPFDPDNKNPKYLDFVKRYRERFGEDPDAYAVHSYDGTMMAVEAIRRSDSTDISSGTSWPRCATGTVFQERSFWMRLCRTAVLLWLRR
jgi:hypothetical protein